MKKISYITLLIIFLWGCSSTVPTSNTKTSGPTERQRIVAQYGPEFIIDYTCTSTSFAMILLSDQFFSDDSDDLSGSATAQKYVPYLKQLLAEKPELNQITLSTEFFHRCMKGESPLTSVATKLSGFEESVDTCFYEAALAYYMSEKTRKGIRIGDAYEDYKREFGQIEKIQPNRALAVAALMELNKATPLDQYNAILENLFLCKQQYQPAYTNITKADLLELNNLPEN